MKRETELAHVSDDDPLGEKMGVGLDEERADHYPVEKRQTNFCQVPRSFDGFPLFAVCDGKFHNNTEPPESPYEERCILVLVSDHSVFLHLLMVTAMEQSILENTVTGEVQILVRVFSYPKPINEEGYAKNEVQDRGDYEEAEPFYDEEKAKDNPKIIGESRVIPYAIGL